MPPENSKDLRLRLIDRLDKPSQGVDYRETGATSHASEAPPLSLDLPPESLQKLADAVAHRVIEQLHAAGGTRVAAAPEQDLSAAADETRRKAQTKGREREAIHDDAFVDQRSGLVPKDVFLRLHRTGALATHKIGRRILARWGDVKAALAAESELRHAIAPVKLTQQDDGLDDLRVRVGLQPKGR